MSRFAIAGIQMHLGGDKNVEAMRRRLDFAMNFYPWVEMVIFSELAPYGPLLHSAQPLPGPAEEPFREMAQRYGIWLVPGSMFEKREGVIHNTTSVINPNGDVIGRYRKMFPFEPYETGVTPGSEFLVFDIDDVGRFGVSICYDMWFPETTRQLTAMGAEVIVHPVLTHTIDRDVDIAIAHASAAMFQCYVFDINGLGAGGTGGSCVIDPSGRFIHRSDGQEEIIPIEIDLSEVRRQRENGLRGLGQTIKSFRDCSVEFPIYDRERFDDSYLRSLGPLVKPKRVPRDGRQPSTHQHDHATVTRLHASRSGQTAQES
jgi:deaminated glutathione amidase